MTYEEAILVLEKDRDLCLLNPTTGERKPMNDDCRKSAEALKIAIEVMKKQTPMSPIEDGYEGIPCVCLNCGQALDWGEEE